MSEKKNVFIIGSKGIPAQYGGFESFVEKLTYYRKDKNIHYYVACLADEETIKKQGKKFVYNDADCFNIPKRNIGPARAIAYDVEALKYCIRL